MCSYHDFAMEVMVVFEGSRRVVTVAEGASLLAVVERELVKRFPERDIAIAPVGSKVSQSVSKEVYILQKLTAKWGYVDVTEVGQVQGGDEVTLTKLLKIGGSSSSSKVSGVFVP